MPEIIKTRKVKRLITINDLDKPEFSDYRDVYNDLRSPEAKQKYLETQQVIVEKEVSRTKPSDPSTRINDRIEVLNQIIPRLEEYRTKLNGALKSLEKGSEIDSKTVLSIPEIQGVTLHIKRKTES